MSPRTTVWNAKDYPDMPRGVSGGMVAVNFWDHQWGGSLENLQAASADPCEGMTWKQGSGGAF